KARQGEFQYSQGAVETRQIATVDVDSARTLSVDALGSTLPSQSRNGLSVSANLQNGSWSLVRYLLRSNGTLSPPVTIAQDMVVKRAANVRFTLSSFYAAWQNPFQVSASVRSELLNRRVTQTFRLFAATPASPLLEGTYVLGRRWGVGFWYNPIRGERLQKTVG